MCLRSSFYRARPLCCRLCAECTAAVGVDLVGLDGTLYDQILDFIVYLGLEPERFKVTPIQSSCSQSCACHLHWHSLQARSAESRMWTGLEVSSAVQGLEGYDKYFAMARGVEDIGALDMSKYFDTNYHYLMPELSGSSSPNANFGPLLEKASLLLQSCVLHLLR